MGRQPDRIDAQRHDMVEPRLDPRQIADPVAVAILERARIDLVDDPAFPPGARVGFMLHRASLSAAGHGREAGSTKGIGVSSRQPAGR